MLHKIMPNHVLCFQEVPMLMTRRKYLPKSVCLPAHFRGIKDRASHCTLIFHKYFQCLTSTVMSIKASKSSGKLTVYSTAACGEHKKPQGLTSLRGNPPVTGNGESVSMAWRLNSSPVRPLSLWFTHGRWAGYISHDIRSPVPHIASVPYPTMHQSHIPQCIIL